MKKIVITLLTACFLVSTGFAEESSKEEIKFRNIEWGCSVDEMYEQFPEISLTDTGKGSYMPYWERFEPGNGKDTTKFATGIDSIGWLRGESLTVAGYNVQFVFADFRCPLDAMFTVFWCRAHRQQLPDGIKKKLNHVGLSHLQDACPAEQHIRSRQRYRNILRRLKKIRPRDLKTTEVKSRCNILNVGYRHLGALLFQFTHRIEVILFRETGPVRIDLNESTQYARRNHMQRGEQSLMTIFGIGNQPLRCNEVIPGDDGGMIVSGVILPFFISVLFGFMVQVW